MPADSLQNTLSGDFGTTALLGQVGVTAAVGALVGLGNFDQTGGRAGATEAHIGCSELGFHYCQSRGIAQHLGFQKVGASHRPLQQSSSCCGHSKRKDGVASSMAGGTGWTAGQGVRGYLWHEPGVTLSKAVWTGAGHPLPQTLQWMTPFLPPPPTNSGWSSVHLEQETDQNRHVAGEACPLCGTLPHGRRASGQRGSPLGVSHVHSQHRQARQAGWEEEEKHPGGVNPACCSHVCATHHAGNGAATAAGLSRGCHALLIKLNLNCHVWLWLPVQISKNYNFRRKGYFWLHEKEVPANLNGHMNNRDKRSHC